MSVDDRSGVLEQVTLQTGPPAWVTLVDGETTVVQRPHPPSVGRVVGRFVVANLIAVALLMTGVVWASATAAKDEAIADARGVTDVLFPLLIEPGLDDQLPAGDPESARRLDAVLGDRLAAAGVVRIKVWSSEGEIVYSDEPRLIGETFELGDDDVEALQDGNTHAELSDLSRPENRYERSFDQLLEVYRQIQTPNGQPMLLETYFPYADATERQKDIWLKFAPISVGVLLALLAMQLPLAYRMVTQIRALGRERELLQVRALDASTEERRRIAGHLHDGIVQDVSASALLVAGAADQLRAGAERGETPTVAEDLAEASRALRHSAGALRSLLVEIYPPNLERAELSSALADLGARLRPRGITVDLDVPDGLHPPLETATLLFRTAQESLLNVAKHAGARHVEISVRETADSLVMEIADDGVGFDLPSTVRGPRTGHLGLSVLADLAAAGGATLSVRTAPGTGTRVRLEVPRP